MKPDIKHRADIERLITTFYEKVQTDAVLGPVFNDVARVDWPKHLPVMYNFWEFLLLGGTQYQGNPIQKHFDLHAVHPLMAEYFDRWLLLFQSSVDELFSGPVADDAKFRAFAIAETWKPKFTGGYGIGLPSPG